MILAAGIIAIVGVASTFAQIYIPQPYGFGLTQYSGSSGSFASHSGYPIYPYGPGLRSRYSVTVPQGLQAQLTIDTTNSRYFSMRPYDFAVIYDGALINNLGTPCVVASYVGLGASGVAYLSILIGNAGQVRTFTSQSNQVVVDFCVDPYNSGYDPTMLGFQAFFSSVGFVSQTATAGPTIPPPNTPTAPLTCGRPKSAPNVTSNNRIVNGAVVPSGGHPWACALIQNPNKNAPFQFCDCTVISAQWVITAGHCIGKTTEAQMKATDQVYFGVTNLLNAVPGTNILGISRVILHPQFDQPVGTTNNDVALIKLASPIPNWSTTLMPICLPTQPITAKAVVTGTKGRRICYVAGWGTLYEGQTNGGVIGSGSDLLLQDAIEMFSASDCAADLAPATFTDKMLCGGFDGGRFDSCQGDSGGPLVCDNGDGTWTLNGIVSWGIGCAEAGKPGAYTNLYALMPWVNQTLATN